MSGSLVLDSDGLSQFVLRTLAEKKWRAVADARNLDIIVSAVTLVEARDPKVPQAAFDHALSRLMVKPVTEEIARAASRLLANESLHGHKYAIDAMVAATAHLEPGDVTVVTSDVEDLTKLCLPRIAVEPV